jgi:hypothetical protein
VLLLSFENSFVVELLVAFGEDPLRIDFCNFLLCNGDLQFISGICQFLEAMRQCQTDEEALLFKDEVCFALQQYLQGSLSLGRHFVQSCNECALTLSFGHLARLTVIPEGNACVMG